MIYDSTAMEKAAVLHAAEHICAAMRTAPKAKGMDTMKTCVVTEGDIETLAAEMERLADVFGYGFFLRDAGNIRASQAVILIGTGDTKRSLGAGCGYCHYKDCAECAEKGGVCVYDPMDLGIAIGSACAMAADLRMDSRALFSAGRAAMELKWLGEDIKMAVALPLSVSGKSPYFDRKPKKV